MKGRDHLDGTGASQGDRKMKLLGRLSPKILQDSTLNVFLGLSNIHQSPVCKIHHLYQFTQMPYFKGCWFQQGPSMWSKGRFGFSSRESLCRISLANLFTPACSCCSWLYLLPNFNLLWHQSSCRVCNHNVVTVDVKVMRHKSKQI